MMLGTSRTKGGAVSRMLPNVNRKKAFTNSEGLSISFVAQRSDVRSRKFEKSWVRDLTPTKIFLDFNIVQECSRGKREKENWKEYLERDKITVSRNIRERGRS